MVKLPKLICHFLVTNCSAGSRNRNDSAPDRRHSQNRKNPAPSGTGSRWLLDRSGNFTGTEASCTHVGLSDRAVIVDTNRLDVRIPLTSCVSVGMGNVVSGYLTLAADLALLGHLDYLLTANG